MTPMAGIREHVTNSANLTCDLKKKSQSINGFNPNCPFIIIWRTFEIIQYLGPTPHSLSPDLSIDMFVCFFKIVPPLDPNLQLNLRTSYVRAPCRV